MLTIVAPSLLGQADIIIFLTLGSIIMSELYFPSSSPDESNDDGPGSAAELQGALCGLLCLDPEANRANWHKKIFVDYDPAEDDLMDLTILFDDTIQSLNSLDFDLQLDLADDNAPLPSRLISMTNWCQGLIFGLGTSGLTDETELSAESTEYIADVVNISQIRETDLDESEEDESNFEELVEYLRMGLFLLHGELQPVTHSDDITEH